MIRDLADRSLDKRIFTSLIDFMNESIYMQPEKPNIIRVFHTILKTFVNKDSVYFKDIVNNGLIMKYVETLESRVKAAVETLGKDNIDSLISISTSLQRTLYKLKKFEVSCDEAKVRVIAKGLQDSFVKIAKKEEMAKSVLSQDVLAKFKAIKESVLRSLILAQSLTSEVSDDFKSFVAFLL